MKIVHIATNDVGGAGIACLRLHQALLNNNIESDVLVLFKYNKNERVHSFLDEQTSLILRIKYSVKFRLLEWKKRKWLKGKSTDYEFISFPYSPYDINDSKLVHDADIIHLHWVSGFLDYPSFFQTSKKIVWTLHDMNPFLGLFHYEGDWMKNQREYSELNQLMVNEKRQSIEKYSGKINSVALSRWMKTKGENSAIGKGFTFHYLPNGIDTENFKAIDKSIARKKMNLPGEGMVLLFVAGDTGIKRKGFELFEKALKGVNPEFVVLVVGTHEIVKRDRVVKIGKLSESGKMIEVYSVADLLVVTSLEDNQPNTILEAYSCGLPVIGFNNTGIAELIEIGRTGQLVENQNCEGLARGINTMLSDGNLLSLLSNNCKQYVKANFSIEAQVRKQIDLYRKVLA